ncbi:hypothetical protein QBC46DRAFT_390333 [Diplogelasinospora grovesii]|uniref:Altered inheritance of mitochondria protein 11 n=1 Tax=Diplogelasinospora grovesii TaxID=303347 RepID=A0AAN6N4T3_9PEZI|nr:hypothetical protein QBC46DRAFT_390333 [Diplogelasinospora grovesii]
MGILSSLLGSALGQSPASAQMSTTPPATTTTASTTIPVQTQTPPKPTRQPAAAAQPLDDQPREFSPVFSTRSLRQLGLFMGGAGFLMFSVLVSRRAVIRHSTKAQLKFYQPNHASSAATRLKGLKEQQQQETTGRDPLVAVEALNLATLNVVSFFIMALGGVSWAFDISSLDDLRRMARRSIHGAGDGGNLDEEAEREVAAWVAKYMGKDKVAKLLEEEGGSGDGGKQDKL